MKIAYNDTINEATHASFRLVEILGIVRKQKWQGLFLALIIFVVVFFIVDDLTGKFVGGFATAGLFMLTHLLIYKERIKSRIRKTLIKAIGTDKPIPCEYIIQEDGLIFKKLGQEIKFSWSNVDMINDNKESIEIIMDPVAIAIIPKRAFRCEDEIGYCVSYIKEKFQQFNPAESQGGKRLPD